MAIRRGSWIPAALAALCLLAFAPLEAGAPMVKTQPPGYYRMMLGDFEITALLDGTAIMPLKGLLNGVSDAQLQHDLAHAYMKEPYELSINAFLVNTGSKLLLIDSGEGGHMSSDTGRLIPNLKAAGYEPAQVDEIYLTHMHGDHLGGISQDGVRLFPNAVVRASREEADYWLKVENLAAASDDAKPSFQHAIDWLEPYVKAGRFQPFDGDVMLLPGVRAVGTPGHTPGHTCYLIESRGNRMLAVGDLVHIEPVQFPDPQITLKFDTDGNAARAERLRIFREAADNREWIAAAHMSFPGLGHIRANGTGYDWVPVSYSVPH
jgi:glyoxylase-like metal-dependent hydrolase (beta-lactamase superfamily II)